MLFGVSVASTGAGQLNDNQANSLAVLLLKLKSGSDLERKFRFSVDSSQVPKKIENFFSIDIYYTPSRSAMFSSSQK